MRMGFAARGTGERSAWAAGASIRGRRGQHRLQSIPVSGKCRPPKDFFLRDPLHRLSNAFNSGLRFNAAVLATTMDILTVHKGRRAPFGGGRFWNEAKETLRALLANPEQNRHLFELYGASIARDHDQSEQVVGGAGRVALPPSGRALFSKHPLA